MRSASSPRTMLLFIVFAASTTMPLVVFADGNPDEPPIVTIYDLDFNSFDTITVMEYETFTLFAGAIGNDPLTYHWLDGDGVEFHSEPVLLDYSFTDPGVFVITLRVLDFFGLEGTDSVTVTVLDDPLATIGTTWAGVKSLYR